MDNNSVVILEAMVNSFTDVNELMNFAATWGIQDSRAVRFRLFQLRNTDYDDSFVNEQLDTLFQTLGRTEQSADFELALEYARMEKEIEESLKTLLFDEEMDETARLCIEDGDWSPEIQEESLVATEHSVENDRPRPLIQEGRGAEPQPGPSHQPDQPRGLRYTMRKTSERTYAKNAAVDRTYQVKIDEQHHGLRLQDVRQGLHQMFEDVLNEARGNLAGNDLGCVVIHHQGLHDPIIVPLQPWDQLNADVVMEIIEKVLNSNQDLSIDEYFEISIGSIELPKGGARRRITRIKGKNNSLQLKTSIVTIENEDQLCMARAIGVSWAKLNRCTPEEWKEITKNRNKKSNLQLILENQKVPETYYKDLTKKKRDERDS